MLWPRSASIAAVPVVGGTPGCRRRTARSSSKSSSSWSDSSPSSSRAPTRPTTRSCVAKCESRDSVLSPLIRAAVAHALSSPHSHRRNVVIEQLQALEKLKQLPLANVEIPLGLIGCASGDPALFQRCTIHITKRRSGVARRFLSEGTNPEKFLREQCEAGISEHEDLLRRLTAMKELRDGIERKLAES